MVEHGDTDTLPAARQGLRFVLDADNHFYEPRDAFTRYIDPRYRGSAVRCVNGGDKNELIMVGQKRYMFGPPIFDDVPVGEPGSMREHLRKIGTGALKAYDYRDERIVGIMRPEYQERGARLTLLAKQGLDAAILLPSLGLTVEPLMRDDPDLTYANLRAFNRWLLEEWGYAFEGKVYCTPLISLLDVERAVEELETVLGAGARIIHILPAPVNGRSPADPVFDPLWARVNEAEVPVAFHVGDAGYNLSLGPHWGEDPNPAAHQQSAFQFCHFFCDRPIMETLSSLVLYNLFGRFPRLKVVSIENGSGWVPYLLKLMNKAAALGRSGPWRGGKLPGKPSEVFRQHVFVVPFHEEDLASLVHLLGADRVLFGSDFPHAEGLAEPLQFMEGLGSLGEPEVRAVMGENALQLLGVGAGG